MSLRVGVIGIGTVGAQVLWQLAQAGCEVTGFELHSPGHPYGAAGGESRLFRSVDMQDLRYLPIVDRAEELWGVLEHDTGYQLRTRENALVIGTESSSAMKIAFAGIEQSDDEYRVLSRQETEREYPQFRLRSDEVAIVDHRAGRIRPELTVYAAAGLAETLGAHLITNTRVDTIDQNDEGSVLVSASGVRYTFDRVVVAAGAWTNALLPPLDNHFFMRRLVNVWFLGQEPSSLEGFPSFIRAEPDYAYGLPSPDGISFKLGLGFPFHREVDSPDDADTDVTADELVPFVDYVRKYFPRLNAAPTRIGTYFEGYTANRREIISRHPAMDNVLVMAGFSGHGFKMSPALGTIGADWATGASSDLDTGFLRADMHGRGRH